MYALAIQTAHNRNATMTKTVLITGAGSGLGAAFARLYASQGCQVIVADVNATRADETRASILAQGGHATAFEIDITREVDWENLRLALAKQGIVVDLLINNAGVASGGPTLAADMDEWQWMLDVNLLGLVRGCRCFVPDMLTRGQGQIINIASFAGLAGAPGLGSYGVAKAAVVAFSESLRAELASQGVRVSVACPAFFKTRLLDSFRGTPRMLKTAAKLMDEASQTADDIASAIQRAAAKDEFLIIPTAVERRRWWWKRHFPDLYFTQMKKLIARRTG